MWSNLTDGRILGVPLAWFPSPTQHTKVEISRIGLHWEELDEDISIAGRGDMTRQQEHAAE